MNDFLIYLLQTAVCLAVFYLIFWVFLRKDTFFKANRFYLMSSLFLSFFLPLFKVPVFYNDPQVAYVFVLETVNITTENISTGIMNNWSVYQSLLIIYLTGVGIFLIRLIFQLFQLFWMIKKNGIIRENGLSIVKLGKKYSSFSYFNYIFLSENVLKSKDREEIIKHEKIHIMQYHSLDLIILELFIILQWFNPFVWLYKFSIKSIHEFLADDGLISNGTNKLFYQNLLLNHTVGMQINDLTNNFNQSLIKKRFIMMTKTKSKGNAKLKYLLTVPITVLLVAFFAINLNQNVFASNEANPEIIIQDDDTTDDIFVVVEKKPQFPGGDKALHKFLATNIKYPEEARKKGVQGSVYLTFVVEKNGSLSGFKVLRGIGSGCDVEAMRVAKMMPDWKPGAQRGKNVRVQFNLPIKFVLNGEKKNSETTSFDYSQVEEMPEFVGGKDAVVKFLQQNLKYPEKARQNKLNGKVFIKLTVLKDGSTENYQVMKGFDPECDAEALRVVKMMKFTPGKANGKKVNVDIVFPISFNLK